MARQYGIRERNVAARRRRLEVEMNQPIQGPRTNPAAHCVAVSEHPHRAVITVPNGTVIVAGDAHYWPAEPSLMHRALITFCRELRPKALVLNGDVIDAPSVSRHAPIGWEARPKLVDEIEAAQDRLHEILSALPQGTERVWNLGNHDARFETRLATVAPEYAKLKGVHLHDHFSLWRTAWAAWINEARELIEIVEESAPPPNIAAMRVALPIGSEPDHDYGPLDEAEARALYELGHHGPKDRDRR